MPGVEYDATSLLSVFVFLAVPLRVIACEGECIEGVTNKFCDLYEAPILTTSLASLTRFSGSNIAARSTLIPRMSRAPDDGTCDEGIPQLLPPNPPKRHIPQLLPRQMPGSHGNEPPGCPNPYCPIVCGTPGSLVYFYLTLLKLPSTQPVNASILRYRRSIIFDDEPSVSHIAQKKNDKEKICRKSCSWERKER
ncbi:hypothetical protein B0H13DRAFT_1970447, partial [Mycena leptocephala]